MKIRFLGFFFLSCTFFFSQCSENQKDLTPSAERPDSLCDSACDSSPLSYPKVTSLGGYGAVTTYGNPFDPEFSNGGACNYGPGEILNYAAVHVDIKPGDGDGLWDGGRHCGDCIRVQVGSEQGWKSVIVRVVDKCPDAFCGIDLGGNPARLLMGTQPGRYNGEWEWVDCANAEGIYDGPPALHTKDGTNQWWSLVHVRNSTSSVVAMRWANKGGELQGEFSWAKEAENFFKVADKALTETDTIQIWIKYRNGNQDTLRLKGIDLGKELQVFPLSR